MDYTRIETITALQFSCIYGSLFQREVSEMSRDNPDL